VTFLRIGISSFFIIAPGVAYLSSMDPKIVVVLLVGALWGLISAAGEGALGLHHIDAYGPLSPYNDGRDGGLTMTGKVSAGIVALLAVVLLFFAASSYSKNKNKQPDPLPTSSPVTSPTADVTTDSTPDPVAIETPDVLATPEDTPDPVSTTAVATPDAPEDPKFEKLKLKAEDKVLSRDYKGAAALLDDLEKQAPNDVDILFFRFLTLQGLGQDDKAKEYAEKILKEHPRSRYERRIDKFLKSFELAKKRKEMGGDRSSVYAVDPGASIELKTDALLAEANTGSLTEVSGSQIGMELISSEPKVKPLNLESGTKVAPMKSVHFFLKTNNGEFSWEKSRNTAGAAEVDLVWVKVLSGKQKGKQGWIINNLTGVSSSDDKPSRNARNVLGLPVIR
jgi:hypothetical protein